jgi:hypothetical protein
MGDMIPLAAASAIVGAMVGALLALAFAGPRAKDGWAVGRSVWMRVTSGGQWVRHVVIGSWRGSLCVCDAAISGTDSFTRHARWVDARDVRRDVRWERP